MRLGSYPCELVEGSIAHEAYGQKSINERHRHRYEFNNDFVSLFESGGMRMTGVNPESKLVEIIEIPDHQWFVGVQFHPEYKSTVENPHPIFTSFVRAAVNHSSLPVNDSEMVKG
jgi:CTP synthase